MRTILTVDDNLASLKMVQTQLADLYRVIPAKSGEQALAIAAKQKPDLILLDVEMPEMDGFAVLGRVRADAELRDIPVIFLTSHHDNSVEARALGEGASDFVIKPFEKSILVYRIELHLKLRDFMSGR